MDKKKKQQHTTENKPKQQSTMEKKKKKKKKQQQNENHKSKSIHDILPLELIHRILLRVPLKQLGRLKCVSKIWNTLISDPDFAKSHVHLSAASTHVCLFIDDYSKAFSVDIDAVFHRHKSSTAVKEERSFSTISMPEQVMGYLNPTHLVLLGGCLALYSYDRDKTNIWVMKEYKVHSSWTFYQISGGGEQSAPLCLSNGSDIVALDSSLKFIDSYLRFAKSNVRGELLQLKCFDCRHLGHFKGWSRRLCKDRTSYIVYTESLVPVPNEIKDKDKDKKKNNGHQNQKNDVKQGKRTRSE
ncbi:uncharacterized protein [Arachis hypogaea]|uniref:uncharacterized protein n=1 Tax=Arachis hypogaea TaxID=3818 RepID=UPI000DED1FF0|nr:putative F-box protein At4g21240 [Arachis hypogaea]